MVLGIDKDIEIEIITDEDESLKILGELLANKTSIDLMKFLMNKTEYKKKISDELGVPFSLVEHHLKKLEKLGLVKITNKEIVKGGILHKHYTITADGIFLMLNTTKEEIKRKDILKKIFKEGIKFACIGLAAISSFMLTQKPNLDDGEYSFFTGSDSIDLTIPFFIVILGLITERIFGVLKKRKRG